MISLLLLFLLPILSFSVDVPAGMSDTEVLQKLMEGLPKECTKNGTKYKEGETFELGRLRYKCQKYGVYSIEGCKTEAGDELSIGQVVVKDNVAFQCLAVGPAVFFRQTTCGIMGQPECDKVPKPTGYEKALEREKEREKQTPAGSPVPGLGAGWSLVEEGRKQIPGTNATIISKTLIYTPTTHQRSVRQSGEGVGTVLGEVDVGTDKPPMPMEMLMGGKKISSSDSAHRPASKVTSSPSSKSGVISTQDVTAGLTLNDGKRMRDAPVKESANVGSTVHYKPGTVAGSHSDVSWKGKKIIVNGKEIGAGPGTFTFGNTPTGAAAHGK